MPIHPEQFFSTFKDDCSDPLLYESQWAPKITAYRERLAASIPPEYRLSSGDIAAASAPGFNALAYAEFMFTAREKELTSKLAEELIALLASGLLTAVELFRAFAKRACIAHQLTNCAMDLFIDQGLSKAIELDQYYANTGCLVGPFHALPVSVKEHYEFQSRVTHAGYVGRLDHVSHKSAEVTVTMEELGAIVFIRTSEPQALMHLDSNNNITGLTMNPHNLSLTPGGSSSGEGALGAFRGSVFGIGSDIGGSIRTPAAFSGCAGLRPTSLRVSLGGCVGPSPGQESVVAVCGPLSQNVRDLRYFMEHYINAGQPHIRDATVIPLPWRLVLEAGGQTFKVGLVTDNGLVRPLPAIERGMAHARAVLTRLPNVEVVAFAPLKTQLVDETVANMYAADGNTAQKALFATSGEPLLALTKWVFAYGGGDRVLSSVENQALNTIRDGLRVEYNAFMEENQLDFLVTPTYANVAPVHETAYNWSYTSIFNLLDFPTLVVQTGLVQDPAVDVIAGVPVYRSPLEELEWQSYDPQVFAGAPIGVQVAGKRYQDEEVVEFGVYLDAAFKKLAAA